MEPKIWDHLHFDIQMFFKKSKLNKFLTHRTKHSTYVNPFIISINIIVINNAEISFHFSLKSKY